MSAGPRLVCAACGREPADPERAPFSCPARGHCDDADHVLRRRLPADGLDFPTGGADDPFIRYRKLFHSWHVAERAGLADDDYVALVDDLGRAVAGVDGRSFTATPLASRPGLAAAGGLESTLLVKDETENVAGSHKARHLMAILIHLKLVEQIGRARQEFPLAIASCGNAARAAAVLARADGRQLDVFLPASAPPAVAERLSALGARTHPCPRKAGTGGDPAYAAFREAVASGSVPFSVQGPDNALNLEGGRTLAWELVASLAARRLVLDRIFVQVGGGALASATIQGLGEASRLGALERLPRLHAVQTEGAAPLARAWCKVVEQLAERSGLALDPGRPDACAERIRDEIPSRTVEAVLADAAHHRSRYMWPWETEPASAAFGILDDETHDWLAVVRGMIETGGFPIVVDEATVRRAARVARGTTSIAVDETGSAGLAGLLAAADRGVVPRGGENVAVLFTGGAR